MRMTNNYKKYKAIFFDWDGTAVESRKAPVNKVKAPMLKLLEIGIPLFLITGTSFENLHKQLLSEMPLTRLGNFYMGAERGAYCFSFDANGNRQILRNLVPDKANLIKLHELCFSIHEYLKDKFDYDTDIIFSRSNYCKIDLMVKYDRGDHMYLKENEIDMVNELLASKGFKGGVKKLIDLVHVTAKDFNLDVKATTDAKYLEVGFSTKSDNVDFFYSEILPKLRINPKEVAIWGDEFKFIGHGVPGSDAMMITKASRKSDFFDVSDGGKLYPDIVKKVGGGVKSFIEFLNYQISLNEK